MSQEALALLEEHAKGSSPPKSPREQAISLLEQRSGKPGTQGPVSPGGRRGRGGEDRAATVSAERQAEDARKQALLPADPYAPGGATWGGDAPGLAGPGAVLNMVANMPAGAAGFVGETVGRVHRLFDSSADPFAMRERFAFPLSVAPTAEVADLMRPVGELAQRGSEWLEQQHPALQAAATTARYGSELLGAGHVARTALRSLGGAADLAASPRAPLRGADSAQSMGAAATKVDLDRLTPELRNEFLMAEKEGVKINPEAAQRLVDADTLPIPMRLTEGQATMDPFKLTHEVNRRGMSPDRGKFYQEQNQQLIDNLDEIRRQAGPTVVHLDPIQKGQKLIDAYKAYDQRLTTDIDAKYQALRDAAGGDWPVDAGALYENISQRLKKELLSGDAPASQLSAIKELADAGTMNFEQFLSLRRNLGNIARTHSDGNTRTAASIMVGELENLPLKGAVADLKPLADEARSAARARFQALEKDPAYRAAVNDGAELGEASPEADNFIRKYVIGGKAANLDQMLGKLADDPEVQQTVTAAALDYLKDKARVSRQGETAFSQAGFNNALKDLQPRMQRLMPEETAERVEQLGRVANNVLHQPKGAAISTSGTTAGMIAEKAAKGAEAVVSAKTGIPVGFVREKFEARSARKEWQEATKPGAGLRMRDIMSGKYEAE